MPENNELDYKDYTKKRNRAVSLTTSYQIQKIEKMKKQLPKYLTARAKQFAEEFDKYVQKNSMAGEFMPEDGAKIPLLELSNHTFKPIIKVAGVIPQYSADELALGYDFFVDCTEKLNKTVAYIPTVEDFCRLMNMSTSKFKEYKTASTDESVREICTQVEDYCYAVSIRAGFSGLAEKTLTIFHNKASNSRRDNDPIQNNTFVQSNTVLNESEFNELARKFRTE